jgi:hypothetical protein
MATNLFVSFAPFCGRYLCDGFWRHGVKVGAGVARAVSRTSTIVTTRGVSLWHGQRHWPCVTALRSSVSRYAIRSAVGGAAPHLVISIFHTSYSFSRRVSASTSLFTSSVTCASSTTVRPFGMRWDDTCLTMPSDARYSAPLSGRRVRVDQSYGPGRRVMRSVHTVFLSLPNQKRCSFSAL